MGTAERADARQHLVGLITSCWQTQALRAAARLDLPDLLASGPSDAATLATACGSVTDPLQRLLRALCTLGICRERRNGRFVLTEAGQWLRREPPGGGPGLRAMALWWGGPLWPVWAGLDDSVRSGRSARLRRTGRAHYAFLDQQPAMAAAFHEAMRSMTALVAEDVAALPTWTGARSVVDVGGGHPAPGARCAQGGRRGRRPRRAGGGHRGPPPGIAGERARPA